MQKFINKNELVPDFTLKYIGLIAPIKYETKLFIKSRFQN